MLHPTKPMSRKFFIALLLAVAFLPTTLWSQTPVSPWNNHQWAQRDVLVPLLRENVESLLSQPDSADLLIEEAKRHLGKPYRYGGKGPNAFDCAGFARYVYMQFGFTLPGGSSSQISKGRRVRSTKLLQRGDLVFWQGREANGRVGHTGIVTEVDTATGRFRFIHAATHSGVIYSYSTEEYYARRYVGACRLLGDRKKPELPVPPKVKKRRR